MEVRSQNLQDQGYFLKEKVYFRKYGFVYFYFPVLEDSVTVLQSLGPALL